MTIKESAVWVKTTKKGDKYLSISITLDNEEKLNINVFKNNKTKDTQPDFKSIGEKKEEKPGIDLSPIDSSDMPF